MLFGRVLIIASSIHAGGNAIAMLALHLMTRGGGDSKPHSATIEAAFVIWQGLGAPLAWAIQMLIDPGWHDVPSFGAQIVLRLVNSLAVGMAIAWIWVLFRQMRKS